MQLDNEDSTDPQFETHPHKAGLYYSWAQIALVFGTALSEWERAQQPGLRVCAGRRAQSAERPAQTTCDFLLESPLEPP